ncbi:MAG: extracellular solute-binding protein [Blautia marasmi]
MYDFFKDAEDENVYLFPESLNCEFFLYRKDVFEKYDLEVPKTWDDFLNVCQTLKEKEEIPLIVAGKENWQLMRYLFCAVAYDKRPVYYGLHWSKGDLL